MPWRSPRHRRSIACGCPARAPSCARTAKRSACPVTTTWATVRLATTHSAPARSTRKARCARGGAIHFLGLHSDGNVHSHLDHLEALLGAAAKAGCKKLYVHALLDGRDVPPTSALEYLDRTER